ncbi:MAG: hypothetical protein ACI4AD_10215 [Roseburia sp.]
MQTFDFSGLNRIGQTTKNRPNATQQALDRLSRSSIGVNKKTASPKASLDVFSITENISELLSPACGMTEEEKQRYLAHIRAKLKAGKKLTGEEMRFLQAEDPILYQQAARIQAMRDSLSASLNQCSSKQEAAEIFSQTMSSVSDKDPLKEYVIAAYEDAYREFRESDRYQSLPQKEDEEEKENEKAS